MEKYLKLAPIANGSWSPVLFREDLSFPLSYKSCRHESPLML
jgi:hypothetical protein